MRQLRCRVFGSSWPALGAVGGHVGPPPQPLPHQVHTDQPEKDPERYEREPVDDDQRERQQNPPQPPTVFSRSIQPCRPLRSLYQSGVYCVRQDGSSGNSGCDFLFSRQFSITRKSMPDRMKQRYASRGCRRSARRGR